MPFKQKVLRFCLITCINNNVGVRTAETELSSGKVTVTGTMDADKLVDYVYRRTKKQAKIVPQPEPEPEKPPAEEPKPEEKKEGEEKAAEEKKEEGEKAAAEGEGEKKEEAAKEEKKEEAKAEEESVSEEAGMHKMMYYYQPLYIIERIPPAPQIFSDENPNACCIS